MPYWVLLHDLFDFALDHYHFQLRPMEEKAAPVGEYCTVDIALLLEMSA
jgi:hypothetical protein